MGLPLVPMVIDVSYPTFPSLSMVVLVDVVQVGLLQAATLRAAFAALELMMGLPLVPMVIEVSRPTEPALSMVTGNEGVFGASRELISALPVTSLMFALPTRAVLRSLVFALPASALVRSLALALPASAVSTSVSV